METEDITLLVVIMLFLVAGGYALYRLGKYVERRDYTAAFIQQVEIAYWQGFDDGRKPVIAVKP